MENIPKNMHYIEQLKSKNRPGGSRTRLRSSNNKNDQGRGFASDGCLSVQSISESVMILCQRSSKRHPAAPKRNKQIHQIPFLVERSLPHLPHSKTYFSLSIQHHEFPCFLNPAYNEIRQTNEKHVAKGGSQRKPI